MASDGPGNEKVDPPGSGPDAPERRSPRRPGDPQVEAMWLRTRPPSLPRPGRPRLSTVLLIVVFIAVLLAYLMLRPGG